MSEEFSTGVKILLQRMESHPEEFFKDSNNSYKAMRDPKWHILMTSVLQVKFKESARGDAMFFTEAEADAVYAGYCKLRRKAFDDYVMREILGVDEEVTDDDAQLGAGGVGGGSGNGGFYGGAGGGGSVIVKTPTGTTTFTKSGTFTG